MLDYIRIACCVPAVKPGDVSKNAQDICAWMEKADAQGADVLLFPELALTGYSCGDLFFQDTLHTAVLAGIREIAACSEKHPALTAVVGLPLMWRGKLYNCAAVFTKGQLAALVPKTHLMASERRWFSPGIQDSIQLTPGAAIPMDPMGLMDLGGEALVGIEICQDALVPQPQSAALAEAGAQVILNLSASPALAGKANKRRGLVAHLSGSCCCVYAYASAGFTESTSDLVYSGHSLIAENGRILKEHTDLPGSDYLLVQDCDLGLVRAHRLCGQCFGAGDPKISVRLDAPRSDGSLYPLRKLPFIPDARTDRRERCLEVFQLQVTGLKQRLKTVGAKAVIGISGGLDSTLALLVAVEAMAQLGRPATDVFGVTMPCFGTSDRTYRNAWELMEKLGITAREISIKEAVTGHFRDIGHDISLHNATYENAQARERTQILMDYASVVGGLVVGTGDLSELALGWCTYNGDHMSMYAVNGTVPKTLIRWIIDTVAQTPRFAAAQAVLQDILDTPISPELLPPDEKGNIAQHTEDLVGPYALHDFFLYHMLHHGFGPRKLYTLACRAFREDFDPETVKKWLRTFCWRFFSQQFKRNCMPDGVKVGSVGLGPRGDWQMPSDAAATAWLQEIDTL